MLLMLAMISFVILRSYSHHLLCVALFWMAFFQVGDEKTKPKLVNTGYISPEIA